MDIFTITHTHTGFSCHDMPTSSSLKGLSKWKPWWSLRYLLIEHFGVSFFILCRRWSTGVLWCYAKLNLHLVAETKKGEKYQMEINDLIAFDSSVSGLNFYLASVNSEICCRFHVFARVKKTFTPGWYIMWRITCLVQESLLVLVLNVSYFLIPFKHQPYSYWDKTFFCQKKIWAFCITSG